MTLLLTPLVNVVGGLIGAGLYATLAWTAWRGWRREHDASDASLAAAGASGIVWQVTALLVFVPGAASGARAATALALAALGATLGGLLFARRDSRRAAPTRWATAALVVALFGVSAWHLVEHVPGDVEAWWAAVLAHHAPTPVALTVLWRDYRFAFGDAFAKRGLTFTILASIAGCGIAILEGGWLPSDLHVFGLVALVVAAGLGGTALRRAVDAVVDRWVMGRRAPAAWRRRLAADVAAGESEDAVVGVLRDAVTDACSAALVRTERAGEPDGSPELVRIAEGRDAAVVRLPTAEPPGWTLEIGALCGGRRLLSDDLALLEWAALLAARRIDTLRALQERQATLVREAELQRLASEAELRALRAQLEPHFLFNALTTIGWLMDEAPPRARETLYALTALLRGVLGRAAQRTCTLGDEVQLLVHYLEIEQSRFEERLQVEVDVPEALEVAELPPLLLQPLVENAVKHGISPLARGGRVTIRARRLEGADGDRLQVVVADTGAGFDPSGTTARGTTGFGVGLSNVEGRLAAHTNGAGRLEVRGAPGAGTTVTLTLPWVVARRRSTAGAA